MFSGANAKASARSLTPFKDATVERFADWLASLTVERENANGGGGGAGKAKIVLCGHRYADLDSASVLF